MDKPHPDQGAAIRVQALELAGATYYARGQVYAQDGHVVLDIVRSDGVIATVSGTQDYHVQLRWKQGGLEGECDCLLGQDGQFCKHQVAVALVWSGAADSGTSAPATRGKRGQNSKAAPSAAESDEGMLHTWLARQDAEVLGSLVLRLAQRDPDLWRQLLARARFASSQPADWRKAAGDLIGRKRFLDYRASRIYARRLDTLAELLREATRQDSAAALALADYALQRLIPIYAESDDSSGTLGDALAGIGALYRAAALAAGPDPDAFAKAWLKLRLIDQWQLQGPLQDYAGVLGRRGLDRLEALTQQQLDALPPPPTGRFDYDTNSSQRHALDALLKELAALGGDVESLLARKAKAVANPWDYLELAQLCSQHGRERQSIDWLERGCKAHPDDTRLLNAMAQSYASEGFAEDALQLRWRAFVARPEESAYLALRDAATALNAWDDWRTRAMTHLDEHPKGFLRILADLKINLLLAEGETAQAWHIAGQTTLALTTWARLQPHVEVLDPEGALRICRTLVQGSADRTHRQGYEEAIGWLKRMAALHRKQGSQQEFADYMKSLRQTYRAKRSFIAMLDAMGS
ncbi:SWIM zinc finger family protein [Pseudoxanthomonas wuyuanensis]